MNKNIIVGAAFFSWGETHRMVGICEELCKRGYHIIFLGEGKYDGLLKGKPFERIIPGTDKEWYTEERIEKMLDMDNCTGNYATYEELKAQVVEEARIMKLYNPVAALIGYRTTFSISARMAKVPLISCMSTVVSSRYIENNITELPEDSPLNLYFSKDKLNDKKYEKYFLKHLKEMANIYNRLSKNWNIINKEFNLPLFENEFSIYGGDLNLMTDARELFNSNVTENETFKFCGPIIYHNLNDLPECAKVYNKGDRKTVFVSVGSSGKEQILKKVLGILKKYDYDYFIASPGIVSEEYMKEFTSNFHFEKNVPLISMMNLCDISIISGGQGTLYSAMLSGKPMIAIPMFMEQQYNIQNVLSQYNCGIMLKRKDISEESIEAALNDILSDSSYQENMQTVRNIVEKYYYDPNYYAEKVSVELIEQFLDN